MTEQWTYPGARWWKFDFHTHTPASKDTSAWQAAIGTPEELTPEMWLLKYMAAEVDCVAVTDHNSGEWIDKLKTSYAQMKGLADQGNPPDGFRELHLFPGVEISVQNGIHLLAIFDPSKNSHTINDLLSRVDYDGTYGDSDGVTRDGATTVVEKVISVGAIAIPAHVDSAKGLLQVEPGTRRSRLDSNTIRQVLQVPGLLALEQCDRHSALPQLLDELSPQFAYVAGSDCHSFRGKATPGSRFTWIKMAKPSIDGLRLALLDGQGVSVWRSDDNNFSPFEKPDHFIESIKVAGARFMGREKPSKIELSPYFNALVGGRGTGKSTIIHALRLAYNRTHELPDNSDAAHTFDRFSKVAKNRNDIGGLRDETRIDVNINRHGDLHCLRWEKNGTSNRVSEWNDVTGSFEDSGSQLVNEQRFPIRLFSQGQIAALAGDSQESLLKVIDDAAGTAETTSEIENSKHSFFVTLSKLREIQTKLKGRDALSISLQDVEAKLAKFKGTDHASLLNKYHVVIQKRQELNRQFQSADAIIKRLKQMSEELVPADIPDGIFQDPDDAAALQSIRALHDKISSSRTEINQIASQLEQQSHALVTELKASPWSTHANDTVLAYEKLKAGLQQQGVNDPSEHGRLVEEKQKIQQEALRLESLKKEHDQVLEEVKTQYEGVKCARRSKSEIRHNFLSSTLEGNLYVKIELVPYGNDPYVIERSLRDMLGISDGKYAEDIYQEPSDGSTKKGLVSDIMSSIDQNNADDQGVEKIEAAIQTVKNRLINAARGEPEFGGWFNKFLKSESEKRPELIDHILCWFPEDGLKVEYSRKGDGRDFQSIGQASAGQRAAAMLAFLLAHGDEPLVLDQPEDDLDNHLIYDLVVQQIRSNKLHRQLIVVTHNPNVVVNGDAELIHVLDFNNQCFIKNIGSLQDTRMRDEVCQIMEGGKEAFERRYQRLGRKV